MHPFSLETVQVFVDVSTKTLRCEVVPPYDHVWYDLEKQFF